MMKWLVDTSLVILLYRNKLDNHKVRKVLNRLGMRRAVFVLIYIVWLQLVQDVKLVRDEKGIKIARLYYRDVRRFIRNLMEVFSTQLDVSLFDVFVKLRRIVDWAIRVEWGGLSDYGDLIFAAFALSTGCGIVTLDKDFVVFGKEFGVRVKYIQQEWLRDVVAKIL